MRKVDPLALLVCVLAPASALAEEGVCKLVDLDFQPAPMSAPAMYRAAPQIVAWIEDANGAYVDTVFITQQTGTFGLGNRPGRADFNSGPLWPYGRRINVFPVWAHRHGLVFDEVMFQNGDENNLSHAFDESSRERHYCRPLIPNEAMWDAGTCATSAFSDKGVLGSKTSKYPPRNDLQRSAEDHASVAMFAMLNPFDTVSRATPQPGVPAKVSWAAPEHVPPGNYVMYFEVSREFDHNATYSTTARPSPSGIPWSEYGAPYRGQPSVVWKVPFTIDAANRTIATTLDYAGYGDPDGASGALNPPDATISTGVQGSGAERLAVLSSNGTPYRLRVESRIELDPIKPAAPMDVSATAITMTSAKLAFTAPGDDALSGRVSRYEIRYRAGDLDKDSFESGLEVRPDVGLVDGGDLQEISINGLLGDTRYTVGIRAIDDCSNKGPITFFTFDTSDRAMGEVPWCFVATAAYGSTMANDVDMLRHFRDAMLTRTVLGELAVEAYYTFSPAVSGVVSESEVMRATARAVLDPLVRWVRGFRF
ncbi:MAG TPA: fibronectin type III domain-containing protein [Kofleriaceae bacterium]|nr:fibronectin type III domain-containing protein [Kofleriaceae bacterium]